MCLQNGRKCYRGQVVLNMRLDMVLSRQGQTCLQNDVEVKWFPPGGVVVERWQGGASVTNWPGGCGEGWVGETKITTITTIMSTTMTLVHDHQNYQN